MTVHIRHESLLLVLTALPPSATVGLLLLGTSGARAFIETQLIATSLFTVLSLGVGVSLATLPMPPPQLPPALALRLPSALCIVLAAVAASVGEWRYATALPMADLLVLSSLYRIPGKIFWSRGVLLAQFLPLLGAVGVWALVVLLVALHLHLAALKIWSPRTEPHMAWRTLGGAWVMSTVKDFFFRGHYLVLGALGLASEPYAVLLRLLDILSRPTDYLFQRLVDHDRIAGRLRRVLIFAPVVVGAGAVAAWLVRGVHVGTLAGIAMAGLTAGLIFLTKYLSFEQNARLQYTALSAVYLVSMLVAAPMLLVTAAPAFPLPFLTLALLVSLFLLLWLNRSTVDR